MRKHGKYRGKCCSIPKKKSIAESLKVPIKLNGRNYKSIYLKHPEIVKGYRGKYFILDLYDYEYKERINFQKGKYIIQNFDPYLESMAEFHEKVVGVLRENSLANEFKIFIKGSADILGDDEYKFSYTPGFKFDSVCFFTQLRKSTFLFTSIEECKSFDLPLYNQDLPNLRALFLKEKFTNIFDPLDEPIILDGKVTSKISAEDRNATLLMFLSNKLFYE